MLPLRLIVVTNTRLFPLLQIKKENTTDNDDERKRKRYKGKRGIQWHGISIYEITKYDI